jgi:hypothetical protein
MPWCHLAFWLTSHKFVDFPLSLPANSSSAQNGTRYRGVGKGPDQTLLRT